MTDPRYHGNEIWEKIGYNSDCIRDISEMFASSRGFSGTNQILQRPTLVAMATKFETKLAITPLV